MTILCPFYKENCKGNQCVMWYDEKCLIVNFLQKIQMDFSEEEAPSEDLSFARYEVEVAMPEDIKSATPEELAIEYINFLQREFPKLELIPHSNMFDLFLESKGLINRFNLPPEMRLKIRRAQMLARNEIEHRNELEHQMRLEREKEELPSLIERCIDWAITNGFKRVTKADVEAFLLENELDILPETRRSLYVMTNARIKAKK